VDARIVMSLMILGTLMIVTIARSEVIRMLWNFGAAVSLVMV
jgi:hypothetical protein